MSKEVIVTIDKHEYKIGSMDVLVQFHVARRLSPILGVARKTIKLKDGVVLNENQPISDEDIEINLKPLLDIIASMKDDDANYVINSCLSVCSRKVEPNGWALVMGKTGVLMYHDLELTTMLNLTFNVIKENLGTFFTIGQQILAGAV